MNHPDPEPIQFQYPSRWKYVFYLGRVAVAENGLEVGQGFKMLHNIERDEITKMQNNILPVHLIGERGREVLTEHKMSIGDHPDF
jgi:hypothetical protein